jgi:hypothetical protein
MATDEYGGSRYPGEPEGLGWIAFAGFMLGLVGLWNVLEGLLAIGDSRVYVDDALFVFSDLNTWGWIVLLIGAAQIAAAFMVVRGSELARWFGVGTAFVNSIVQLYFLPAFPLWAITMFAVDVLIIFALVVYGGRRLKAI